MKSSPKLITFLKQGVTVHPSVTLYSTPIPVNPNSAFLWATLELEVAQWVYACLTGERPQIQLQSLLGALLRSFKQAPIDGNH